MEKRNCNKDLLDDETPFPVVVFYSLSVVLSSIKGRALIFPFVGYCGNSALQVISLFLNLHASFATPAFSFWLTIQIMMLSGSLIWEAGLVSEQKHKLPAILPHILSHVSASDDQSVEKKEAEL